MTVCTLLIFFACLFLSDNFFPVFSPLRYNFTNADEPSFTLDMLELINSRLIEENDSVLIVVYAVNQKGKSLSVVVRDFELGATQNIDKGKEERVGMTMRIVEEEKLCLRMLQKNYKLKLCSSNDDDEVVL